MANIIDKLIGVFSPLNGIKRLEHRGFYETVASDPKALASAGGSIVYDAASSSVYRMQNAYNNSFPVDEDSGLSSWARSNIRLECRHIYRNAPLAVAAINRFADYTVGSGIVPQVITPDEKWNILAEKWWNNTYSPFCDARNRNGIDLIFHQKLAVISRLIDGDCLYHLLKNGQFQPIESERITTPNNFITDKNIVDGVKLSKGGIPLGYYICNRKDGYVDRDDYKYVRRENTIYFGLPIRIDQVRSIPKLAPVVNSIKDYYRTQMNVQNKIKMDATQLFKPSSGNMQAPSRQAYSRANGNKDKVKVTQAGEWGKILHQDLEAFESKTPNSQYVVFMKYIVNEIAAALGVPPSILLMDFSNGSYSSQRQAAITARKAFQIENDYISRLFLKRLWNWRVAMAMSNGELPPAPVVNGKSTWYMVKWSNVNMQLIDPTKEASAAQTNWNLGMASLKTMSADQGFDRDEMLNDKQSDIEQAIIRASAINKKYPDVNITWHDLVNSQKAGAPSMITDEEVVEEIIEEKETPKEKG